MYNSLGLMCLEVNARYAEAEMYITTEKEQSLFAENAAKSTLKWFNNLLFLKF